jgi:hypothetical protein
MDEQNVTNEKSHEGFRLSQTRVGLPLDNGGMTPKTQLDLLICHLFVNEKRPISGITRLGFDRRRIIQALLQQGAICDRRLSSRAPDLIDNSRQR